MRHSFPVVNTTNEVRIIVVPNKGPTLLCIFICIVLDLAASLLDKRLGVFEVSIDGLDGGVYTILLRKVLVHVGRYERIERGTNLSNLLAQDSRFCDHSLAVCSFP